MDRQTKIEMSRVLIENILPNQLEQWAKDHTPFSSLKITVEKFEIPYKNNEIYLSKMSNINDWIAYININLRYVYSITNHFHTSTGIALFEFNMQEAIDLWNKRNV